MPIPCWLPLLVALQADADSEWLLVGGRVITLDPDRPEATAVAIRGDRIVGVGDEETCAAAVGPDAERVELDGRVVTRGSYDGYARPSLAAARAGQLHLGDVDDLDESIRRIRDRAGELDVGAWVLGHGLDPAIRPGDGLPWRNYLDEVTDGWPTLLVTTDGRLAICNTTALNLAGIGPETFAPDGGRIERDDDRRPTGVLSGSAIDVVARLIPPADPATRLDATAAALDELASLGVTSCVDVGGDPDVYRRLLDEGRLPVRIELWADLRGDLDNHARQRDALSDDTAWIRFDTLSLEVDGDLSLRAAALDEPYEDDRTTTGTLLASPDEVDRLLEEAEDRGFRVALVAHGERGARLAIDALERAGTTSRVQRVVVDLITPEDAARVARLGAVAVTRPQARVARDAEAIERLGAERWRRLEALRALPAAGASIALGSDAPLWPADPRAVSDAATKGSSFRRLEALHAITVVPARASLRESELGAVAPGSLADLVVLDGDPTSDDPAPGDEVRVWATMMGGRWTYRVR